MLVVDGEGVFREVLFGEELKEKHTFFSEKRHCFSYRLLPFKEKYFHAWHQWEAKSEEVYKMRWPAGRVSSPWWNPRV